MNLTASSASVGMHAGIALLVMLGAGHHLDDGTQRAVTSAALPLVLLAEAGMMSGGREQGPGNRRLDPPSAARNVGHDQIALSRPRALDPTPRDLAPSPEVPQPVDAPVVPQSAGLTALPGFITAIVTPESDSRGPGDGPEGAGPGRRGRSYGDSEYGSGPGPGRGPGPGGLGDGAGGIDPPVLIKQVKPAYTVGALQARIQGAVLMDAVVLTDGTVGDVRIVRSLDRQTGLDDEAVKAVKQWRFRPGTRAGRPVPVLVAIELTFTLR